LAVDYAFSFLAHRVSPNTKSVYFSFSLDIKHLSSFFTTSGYFINPVGNIQARILLILTSTILTDFS